MICKWRGKQHPETLKEWRSYKECKEWSRRYRTGKLPDWPQATSFDRLRGTNWLDDPEQEKDTRRR